MRQEEVAPGAGGHRAVGTAAVIDLAAIGREVAGPAAVAPEPSPVLGRLGELAGWLAAAQGCWPPTEPVRPRLVLVAPGGAAAGDPPGRGTRVGSAPASDAPASDAAAGRAPARTGPARTGPARTGPASRDVAGGDVAGDPAGGVPAAVAGARTAAAGQDLPVRVVEAAGDVEAALGAGIAAADAAADEGADLLVVAGFGAEVPAATAVAALTGLEPTDAVATGLGDAQWRREVVGVRDLLRLVRPHAGTPYALLSTVDSPVLGALAGLVLQAAARRTPTVLDGLAACAAAITVYRLAPFIEDWWLVADRTGSPAQHAALELMQLRPVFELDAADGCAGPLVVPVLRAAARLSTPDIDR